MAKVSHTLAYGYNVEKKQHHASMNFFHLDFPS